MASWMVHLRVADALLDALGDLPPAHFVVGNVAPDSGEPVDDSWSVFTPSREVSHWKIEGIPYSGRAEMFRERYVDEAAGAEEAAFYLGYYVHLYTDYMWVRDVFSPIMNRYEKDYKADLGFTREIKRDMYDLDHLFISQNPGFRAFAVFSGVGDFPNRYLDYFSESAFEKKIAYITGFYKSCQGDLDREYPYVTKDMADTFVTDAINEIQPRIAAVLAALNERKLVWR